jgi:hypothetical protein
MLIDDRIKQQDDPRLAGLNTLTYSVWLSRGAGLVLSVDGAMILLPMCRNILRYIRPKIKFLPLDESQWFHRQVAYSLLIYTIIHASAHYVKYVISPFPTIYMLIRAASSTLRERKFERSPLSKSIIQRLEVLQAISCSFACFSCTPPRTTRFVSNHSRPSGTPIISSFHSCSVSTPMPPDASFATLFNHFLHSTPRTSGLIALVMKVGVGSSGGVDSISSNACTERSAQEERRRLLELFAIHTVSTHDSDNQPRLTVYRCHGDPIQEAIDEV